MSLSTEGLWSDVAPCRASSAVLVPTQVRHAALKDVLARRTERDQGQRERPGTVNETHPRERNARLWIPVLHEKERIVLRVVADAVDGVLVIHAVRRRRHKVVPQEGRSLRNMPPRVAAEVGAAVEARDDPEVAGRVVVEERVSAREGVGQRIREVVVRVHARDADHKDRVARSRDEVPLIAEYPSPDGGRALPELEIPRTDR